MYIPYILADLPFELDESPYFCQVASHYRQPLYTCQTATALYASLEDWRVILTGRRDYKAFKDYSRAVQPHLPVSSLAALRRLGPWGETVEACASAQGLYSLATHLRGGRYHGPLMAVRRYMVNTAWAFSSDPAHPFARFDPTALDFPLPCRQADLGGSLYYDLSAWLAGLNPAHKVSWAELKAQSEQGYFIRAERRNWVLLPILLYAVLNLPTAGSHPMVAALKDQLACMAHQADTARTLVLEAVAA